MVFKSPMGKDTWQQTTVISILTNEKYKGDALLQKEFVSDFLTKKRKKNNGEIPQYYVVYQCNNKFKNKQKCGTPHLTEDEIKQVAVKAINQILPEKNELIAKYEKARMEYEQISSQVEEKETKKKIFMGVVSELQKLEDTIEEFDEDMWGRLIEGITVYSKSDIRVSFKNGLQEKISIM